VVYSFDSRRSHARWRGGRWCASGRKSDGQHAGLLQEGAIGKQHSTSFDGAALLQPQLFRTRQRRLKYFFELVTPARHDSEHSDYPKRRTLQWRGAVRSLCADAWSSRLKSQIHSTSRTPDL